MLVNVFQLMRFKKTSIFLVEPRLCGIAPGFDYKMCSGWIISVQVKENVTAISRSAVNVRPLGEQSYRKRKNRLTKYCAFLILPPC